MVLVRVNYIELTCEIVMFHIEISICGGLYWRLCGSLDSSLHSQVEQAKMLADQQQALTAHFQEIGESQCGIVNREYMYICIYIERDVYV